MMFHLHFLTRQSPQSIASPNCGLKFNKSALSPCQGDRQACQMHCAPNDPLTKEIAKQPRPDAVRPLQTHLIMLLSCSLPSSSATVILLLLVLVDIVLPLELRCSFSECRRTALRFVTTSFSIRFCIRPTGNQGMGFTYSA